MKAMVLAAGKGTRLAPLTNEVPKPMAPVAGKPMIQYIFELLERAGVDEVNANVHHLADAILEHYGYESCLGSMVVNITREEELAGTAGGVRRISDRFDETFIVVMGDALTDVDLREVVAFHRERGALATLALRNVTDTSRYGVVELDPDRNIQAFQEKPHPGEAKSTLANTGIYVLEPEVLEYIPEETFFDFADDVFPRLLEAGERFVGYESDFYWSDVGTPEAYRAAQRDVLSGKVQARIPGERWGECLWRGQDTQIHPTAFVEGRAVICGEAVVGPEAVLAGDVAVGEGCRVEPGATVRRSVLLPGSSVGIGASLEDCIVGPGYGVRPGECLREEILVRRVSQMKHRKRPRLEDVMAAVR